MKKIKLLFSVLLVGLLTLASCRKEPTDSRVIEVRSSQSTLTFECEDSDQQILEIFADGDWRITSDIPSWLTVSPTEGFGTVKVAISATDNMRDGAPDKIRTTALVFKGNKNTECSVTIKQLGDKFRDIPAVSGIKAVVESEDGAIIILPKATVLAASANGYVVADEEANLVVRVPLTKGEEKDGAIAIGDVVSAKSDKQTELALPVLRIKEDEGDQLSIIGSETPAYPEEAATPDIDTYAPASAEYVSFTGKLDDKGNVVIGTIEKTEEGSIFKSSEKTRTLVVEGSDVLDFAEYKDHVVKFTGYFTGKNSVNAYMIPVSFEDQGRIGKVLTKVLYYDDFNAQSNNTPDLIDGYVKDMQGAGVSNTTYTAGRLVDFRNTYNQSHDGGGYNDYENELWPNKTSQYDHSGGKKDGGKPMHLYPCVTPGEGQSSKNDAWFQINEIEIFNSTAIQLGFAAFGVDGPSQVDYTFKYKFDNQQDWTVYKAFRIQQYWQWISLDQITVPAGAKSVSFRGEAEDKNYIRLDDLTLVGDDDGGFVEPVLELVTPSPLEIDATAQDVTVQFRANMTYTHNLEEFKEWITPKDIQTKGEDVTVTLGVAANDGNDREAVIVVKNEEKGKEIKLTLKQEGGAQKYLELVGEAIKDDAFSVGREGAEIVAKYKTNVTPKVEGLPAWATIKGQETADDITTVTITVAPNTTSKVRNAVIRVFNADVENDILYYISQDCTLPTGSDILFAENFDWMKDYYQEYADANSGKTFGDSVGKRDKDANSPNFYSAAGLDGLKAKFAEKGYGDSNAGKKVIYPNDAYLKFGKSNVGTRLVLPALDVEGTVDATITFNYAFQIQGTGKVDETELFVFVDGNKVNAEKLPTTQLGGDVNVDPRVVRDFTWQTATLELKGISKASKIEIGNENLTITQRFFLDNIVIEKKSTSTVVFEDDFEWMDQYSAGSNAADSVADDNPSGNAPNIYNTAALEPLQADFASKGYDFINSAKNGAEWVPISTTNQKVVYLQKNYLKFGKTSYNAGIVLPVLDKVSGTQDLKIEFDWCWHVTGSFNADIMTLQVEANGGGTFENGTAVSAEITSEQSTEAGQSHIVWQHATVTLKGATSSTRLTVRPTNTNSKVSNPERDQNRWYIDNIKISAK
ncbi:MAG: hypothetical protein MJY92_06135 [Bacteroidales bacterium]|nr:hypothetical protein [Bacteroidales bacterium]